MTSAIAIFSSRYFQFSSQSTTNMSYYQFEWKANQNFCVTAKHVCDFECAEADTEVPGDCKFHKFARKIDEYGTFTLIGYFKTQKAAEDAMIKTHSNYYSFLWNRKGECVDGCY